ncbi:hypothetical protein BDW02DRAFT_568143 [Decorospora gaudefroyi]|uniref:Uncharacterized protein n=1 Tax=Decorospora gaudefroyi TaxID=184978 RepID=A0A6A5KDC2_9PLEO|nr:hypothetical protein BDW02DRAFT_568143 [Decorospora gaudefroyi]
MPRITSSSSSSYVVFGSSFNQNVTYMLDMDLSANQTYTERLRRNNEDDRIAALPTRERLSAQTEEQRRREQWDKANIAAAGTGNYAGGSSVGTQATTPTSATSGRRAGNGNGNVSTAANKDSKGAASPGSVRAWLRKVRAFLYF